MLADLIARVPSEVEAKVRLVRDRARPALQEALRAECRLVLRTPEDSANNRPGAQVPIEVEPGYPVVLEHISFSDDFAHIMSGALTITTRTSSQWCFWANRFA